MSFFRVRGRLLTVAGVVVSAFSISLTPAAIAQSSGASCHSGPRGAFGLTSCERALLAKLPYAALPNPVPPGFKVVPKKLVVTAHSYRVVYHRADDAEIIYEGSDTPSGGPRTTTAIATAPPAAPANPTTTQRARSFFQRFLGEKPKTDTNTSAGYGSGEQERSPHMAAVANSPVVGTVRFATDAATGCLDGHSDAAVMRNGRITVRGCGLDSSDPIVRSVQTTARVSRG
jgi:hypothetical protein